jgi:glycosyltransferase involved in cell wall biosynthesis
MKIFHIITGLNDGGAEGVLFRLTTNNKENEHIVVSLSGDGKYGQLLRDKGITVHTLDMGGVMSTITAPFRLYKLVRKFQPDVVQTWMYHADLLGGVVAKFAGIKKIFWGIRNTNLSSDFSSKGTIVIAKLCAFLSFIPSKIICCAFSAKNAHITIGYDPRKMVVIHNGYELSRFTKNLELRNSIRKDFDVSDDTFLIGTVGRYHPQKDHKNLLTAIGLFHKENKKFKVILVGQGLNQNNKELNDLICQFGLQDFIILADARTDIPAIMNSLDLHVLASKTEGFPNVVAEAMACGTLCISTDVGDAKHIVLNDKFICKPNSSELLCERISEFYNTWMNEPQIMEEYKSEAYDKIHSQYSLRKMILNFENVWFQ